MDLFLWRHAEAQLGREDGSDDLLRVLTPRGEKQAARIAAWLERQLPDTAKVYVSPARRTVQTLQALGRKYKIKEELAPSGQASQLLELVHWPQGKATALVVGHQPMLGQVIAQLLGLKAEECMVRKGAVWWLRHREREGSGQTVLVSVQSPDAL